MISIIRHKVGIDEQNPELDGACSMLATASESGISIVFSVKARHPKGTSRSPGSSV